MKSLSFALIALSSSAISAQAQSGPIAAQCKPDIDRYCAEVQHIQGGIRLCLDQHLSLVTTQCRAALESAGPRSGRQGSGMGGPGRAALGLRQIITLVQDIGYTDIREVEIEGSTYEIEATDPEGKRSEIYVDAVTGKILRKEPAD